MDIHALGSTPRASDSRIVMSIAINGAIVIGMYFLTYNNGQNANAIIMGVFLSWVSSHNIMLSAGIVKPFNVINEKL